MNGAWIPMGKKDTKETRGAGGDVAVLRSPCVDLLTHSQRKGRRMEEKKKERRAEIVKNTGIYHRYIWPCGILSP